MTVILVQLLTTPGSLTLEIRDGRYVESGSGRAYSGYYTRCYPGTEIKEAEGRLRNGLMDDLWTFYFPNGNLKSEIEFVDGVKIKTLLSFYENGEKESEFDEDSQVYTTWYANGKLKSFIQYLNGMKEGLSKEWYDDGQLKSEYEYFRHHEHGICKEYYRRGQVALVSVYRDGKKSGFWQAFYPDGKLKFEGRYSEDKKTGKWLETDSSGKMAAYHYF